jgi:hypothetical protein
MKEPLSTNGRYQVLSQYIAGRNEENHEDSQDAPSRNRDLNLRLSEYKAGHGPSIIKKGFARDKARGT